MRIFLGSRNKKVIEGDERISKYNYGSRQGYSIKEVILEKRLMYDISRMNKKLIAYIITDLKACYNRKLSQITRIIEELVGIKRARIKLIVKILPILKHQICIGFGISIKSYSSNKH